jgi:hypothetical protein
VGAQWLRSVHQSLSLRAAFNGGLDYRVSGVFRRQHAAGMRQRFQRGCDFAEYRLVGIRLGQTSSG